ncbi:MAG: oxidoreductase, partial [Lentisphaerae bacterium]|nr:oxidoreductase [Lentisphaerota bacterium]
AAYVQYGYDAKVEIVGTRGSMQVGRSDGAFLKCTTVENGTSTPFITSWMTLFKDAYLEEDSHFIDCIINDRTPRVTGLDGKMAVKIVEVGNRSITEKKLIEL